MTETETATNAVRLGVKVPADKTYDAFLASKKLKVFETGFRVELDQLNPMLFDWQKLVVQTALRHGQYAMFAECGLGKTPMQVEWAYQVSQYANGGKVLVLAPLSVAHQTVREARKFNRVLRYVRSQDEILPDDKLIIINYEMLKHFDVSSFVGVALDESSLLKNFNGKTKQELCNAFLDTPYKLCCTATPAPNDYLELGNHSQFLGVMDSNEMISRWFINDQMNTGNYRLKKHAEKDYWRWVTSWAACISKPGDIGFSNEGYDLPMLDLIEHVVSVDHSRAFAEGKMFVDGTQSATSMWAEKKATLKDRCNKAIEIVNNAPDEVWCVWCETNDEADYLKKRLPQAVEVRGSDLPRHKETRLNAFSDGDSRLIITKPDIAGLGLNWQHCHNTVFVGLTYSFEKLYQALRRFYRFGQQNQVNAHLVVAESEGNVMRRLTEKQAAFREMQAAMNTAMHENGLFNPDVKRELTAYNPTKKIFIPNWLVSKAG